MKVQLRAHYTDDQWPSVFVRLLNNESMSRCESANTPPARSTTDCPCVGPHLELLPSQSGFRETPEFVRPEMRRKLQNHPHSVQFNDPFTDPVRSVFRLRDLCDLHQVLQHPCLDTHLMCDGTNVISFIY